MAHRNAGAAALHLFLIGPLGLAVLLSNHWNRVTTNHVDEHFGGADDVPAVTDDAKLNTATESLTDARSRCLSPSTANPVPPDRAQMRRARAARQPSRLGVFATQLPLADELVDLPAGGPTQALRHHASERPKPSTLPSLTDAELDLVVTIAALLKSLQQSGTVVHLRCISTNNFVEMQ